MTFNSYNIYLYNKDDNKSNAMVGSCLFGIICMQIYVKTLKSFKEKYIYRITKPLYLSFVEWLTDHALNKLYIEYSFVQRMCEM